jgi:hypothetical protein
MDKKGVERIPFLIWDDAGLWLFAMKWYDPFIVAFLQELNVIGTKVASLILTTPSPKFVLKKIREFPDSITVRIMHATHAEESPDVWQRVAVGYKHRYLPSGTSRVRKLFIDQFSAKMPDDFYAWYKPVRDGYEKLERSILQEKWEQIKEQSEILKRKYPTDELPSF